MPENVKTEQLVKTLKKYKRYFRRMYSQTLPKKDKEPYDEWLCDNYYIFERECMSCISSFKNSRSSFKKGKTSLPRIFEICIDEICKDGKVPDETEMTECLVPFKISGREAEMLPDFIRCAILFTVRKSFEADNVEGTTLIGNCVKSLRRMPDIDFEKINDELNPVEKILVRDPSGSYPKLDEASKAMYRELVEIRAVKEKTTGEEIAREALKKAQKAETPIDRCIEKYILPEKRRKLGAFLLILKPILAVILSAALATITKAPRF
ncbi:MAG: hypothetical protein K6F09_02285 [Clostridiales bacterium]|nr:hypothetical protein [Clostridiales bacterium]